MSAVFSTCVENMLASLQRTLVLASNCGDEDLHNVELYSDLAKQICEIEAKDCKNVKALSSAKEANSIREFDEIYNDALNRSKPSKTQQNRYNSFLVEAKSVLENTPVARGSASVSTSDQQQSVEQGDVILETYISDIDPITKKRMVHPLRNKVCGHHYEKSSILQSMKINGRLKCPVVGCKSKEIVVPSNLEEDAAFMRLLQENQMDSEEF